jgi:hypothetical protein
VAKDKKGQLALLIEHIENRLDEPPQISPRLAKTSESELVSHWKLSAINDHLTNSKVPPNIHMSEDSQVLPYQ